jgi:hypothetical protein
MIECRSMPRRIGVVTAARSDYGHLAPVLAELRATPGVELQLFVAGSHLVPRFGETVRLIEADGWPIAERVDMRLESDAPEAIARSIASPRTCSSSWATASRCSPRRPRRCRSSCPSRTCTAVR